MRYSIFSKKLHLCVVLMIFYYSCVKDFLKLFIYSCIQQGFYKWIGGDFINRKSKDILAINLKYYRYLSKLSQEKFAEALDTNLIYENQLEKGRRNPSLDMLDKISEKISELLDIDITSHELLLYDESKIIYSRRIDGKKD